MLGRDGRAGGCDVLAEIPLVVAVTLGNVDVVDEGVEMLSIEHHQLCARVQRACATLTWGTSSFPRFWRRDCTHPGRGPPYVR